MEDADLIARVYPVLHISESALKAIKASSRCVPLPHQSPRPEVQYGRHERESTQPPEDKTHHAIPCIEVKFSDIPRSHHGIIFGCDPKSDVVLPNLKGISYHQFSLTFDAAKRVIVKDWGSLAGTEVKYSDQGHGKRRRFQWIVSGHDILDQKDIIISISEELEFRIVVAHQNLTDVDIDKVNRFCQGTASTEDLFHELDLPPRPDTEFPTGAHTPGSGAIHLRKKLGKGAFGVVTYFWNVSTGEEYALKKPRKWAVKQNKVREYVWRREARIMSQLSHPNIVRLIEADFTTASFPQLYLEYVPKGSLYYQDNISPRESLWILCQCLSALEYLHSMDPPIVHRDIKPDNILVQWRYPNSIWVKFGDFGLSRDSYDLTTICGTREYIAPEIYERERQGNSGGSEDMTYSTAVDIWSLGVVVYELMCNLPRFERKYELAGAAWGKTIINEFERDLNERPDELRRFLLRSMMVISPESRDSALDCLNQAKNLPNAAMDLANEVKQTGGLHIAAEQQTLILHRKGATETTSTDGYSSSSEDGGPTLRVPAVAAGGSAEPVPAGVRLTSAAIGRPVRFDAPSPPFHAPVVRPSQKRPTESSTSSSPGRRRSKRPDHRSQDIEATSRRQASQIKHDSADKEKAIATTMSRKSGTGSGNRHESVAARPLEERSEIVKAKKGKRDEVVESEPTLSTYSYATGHQSDADHYPQITESSRRHGSYLPTAKQSSMRARVPRTEPEARDCVEVENDYDLDEALRGEDQFAQFHQQP